MPNQHVTPHPDGGWQVKPAGGERASGIYDTQAAAIAAGKEHAMNQGTELFIHNRGGQIRERSSFGNDPYPPKG